VQQWLVGGAVIESEVIGQDVLGVGGVLLVENLRRGGRVDWTPPGGVIDAGETVLDGLTREVREETGLVVRRWSEQIYRISAQAPGLGWHLRVEVHRALEVSGDLRTGADPDGIVISADVVEAGECEDRLCDSHPWVREPLLAWLGQRWAGSREFNYLVEGSDPAHLTVSRHGE
jgi:8-oxo-dGTP diphosphatase